MLEKERYIRCEGMEYLELNLEGTRRTGIVIELQSSKNRSSLYRIDDVLQSDNITTVYSYHKLIWIEASRLCATSFKR